MTDRGIDGQPGYREFATARAAQLNHTLPQVDRPRPPGSMAEWEAVVENPAWHL